MVCLYKLLGIEPKHAYDVLLVAMAVYHAGCVREGTNNPEDLQFYGVAAKGVRGRAVADFCRALPLFFDLAKDSLNQLMYWAKIELKNGGMKGKDAGAIVKMADSVAKELREKFGMGRGKGKAVDGAAVGTPSEGGEQGRRLAALEQEGCFEELTYHIHKGPCRDIQRSKGV